ncbi:hypothetical protein [Psittacicella hinzii]|uniref:Uncharacterized protein n=1 Tax=Psittacicella hinzii TaxID=2028575 RepID=A0A3A1YMG3_9GAMM|nr:hypothetical protein [Psittacicella hinzii]RIY39483.1 hypothetical protein CKF58_02140 [Psittacicella hinzii]
MAVNSVKTKTGNTYDLTKASRLYLQKGLGNEQALASVNYTDKKFILTNNVTTALLKGSVIKVENATPSLNGYWVVEAVAANQKEIKIADTRQKTEFESDDGQTTLTLTGAKIRVVEFADYIDYATEIKTPDVSYNEIEVTSTTDQSPQTVPGQPTYGDITLTVFNAPDKEQFKLLEKYRLNKDEFVLRHVINGAIEYYFGTVTKLSGATFGTESEALKREYTIKANDADITLNTKA